MRLSSALRALTGASALVLASSLATTPVIAQNSPLSARTYSEEQLFGYGWDNFQRGEYPYAAMHLHAYLQLRPAVLRSDPAFAKQVVDAWYFSAQRMEDIERRAQRLSTCESQLARARNEPAAAVSGLGAAPPAVDWERIRAAAGYKAGR